MEPFLATFEKLVFHKPAKVLCLHHPFLLCALYNAITPLYGTAHMQVYS